MEVTVTVPMDPPSALLPNKRHRRGGLYPGISAATESREVAKYAAMNDRGQRPTISGPVELEVHAAYGYKRVTPDLDGTLSACKPMIDGLVDAGIIYDDDQVQRLIVTHEKLKTRKHVKPQGYTVFRIRELTEETP